jgi:GntR family transcriptional regulator
VRRLGSDRFLHRDGDGGEAADRAEMAAEGAGGEPAIDHVIVTEEQPEPDIAERLRLRAKTKVVVRRRRYLVDGRPVEMATSYVPAPIARRTPIARPDSGPGGIYARLEELGHKLDHVDEEVRARMPTPDEVEALQLPTGVPVLHLVRTAFDTNGRPVEVCDTVMSADAFVLDYQLPAR